MTYPHGACMTRRLLLLAALAFVIAADKADPEPAKLPRADTRGTVTDVQKTDSFAEFAWFHVEAKKGPDTKHGSARLTVGAATRFYRWKGGKKVEASFEDLAKGCKVQVLFAGEAKVVDTLTHASAIEVLILESPKK